MKNQLTSAIISLVLAATMTTPTYVFADEETVRTYEGDPSLTGADNLIIVSLAMQTILGRIEHSYMILDTVNSIR